LNCHWGEIVVFLSAVTLILLLFYGKSIRFQEWVYSNFKSDTPIVKQTIVRSKSDLPTFHFISADDIREEYFETTKKLLLPAKKDIRDRFTLKKIPADAVIRGGDISTAEILQNKPVVVSFAVSLHSLSLARIGKPISLLFAPAIHPANIDLENILIDGILLDKKSSQNGGSILVSIDEDDLSKIIPYIGKSEILLLRSVR